MKNLRTLGLTILTAMALMAFSASSASATSLYNGTTKLSNTAVIDLSIPSGGSVNWVDTSGNTFNLCKTSTVKVALTTNEGTPSGSINQLSWSGCTFTTNTTSNGGLKISQIGGTTNGKVESNATIEVTIKNILFGDCIYGVTANTEIGTLTTNSSTSATYDVNAVAQKLSGCPAGPETLKWTGTYISLEPVNLRVEAS